MLLFGLFFILYCIDWRNIFFHGFTDIKSRSLNTLNTLDAADSIRFFCRTEIDYAKISNGLFLAKVKGDHTIRFWDL